MRRGLTLIELLIIVVIVVVLLSIVGGFFISLFGGLFPNYSDGQRTGVIVKISKKGLMWKSTEGSMNIGSVSADANGMMVPSAWAFSVRNDDVVRDLQTAADSGKRVTVHYHQYWHKPMSIDTQYVVDGVIKPPAEEPAK